MAQDQQTYNRSVLKSLAPIDALSLDNLEELFKKSQLRVLEPGKTLIKIGSTDNFRFYLLSGTVILQDMDGQTKDIDCRDPVCKFPLVNHIPRRLTVIAKTEISYLKIDNDLLDLLLTWDQSTSYVVAEIQESRNDDCTDWMTRILQSESFQRVPPANIQSMFMSMQEQGVRKGQTIIKQGETADNYYLVKRGTCQVSRHNEKTGHTVKLATLEVGDGFGEEALLTDTVRNATVTMTSDGVLMKLSQTKFNDLLKAPLLTQVSYTDALQMKNKGAVFLDVRLYSEIQDDALEGSQHIPFSMLRQKAESLDKGKSYVVYCGTGRRSSAAAYLLNERGFDAYVLEGGLSKQTLQVA